MIRKDRTRTRGVLHLWHKDCYIGAVVGRTVYIMPHWKTKFTKNILPHLDRGLQQFDRKFAVPFKDQLPQPPKERKLTPMPVADGFSDEEVAMIEESQPETEPNEE